MAFEDESLYAVIAIPVIFIVGFVGALLPSVLVRFFPNYGATRKLYFSFANGVASGLILSVGFIHSLPESVEAFEGVLTDEDSTTHGYPWSTFIALVSVLIMFTAEELLDTIATWYGVESFHSHGGSGAKNDDDDHHHHRGHEDNNCAHTVEEHAALDGSCDAQPLEELCTHGRTLNVSTSSSSDSDRDPDTGKEEEGGQADIDEKREAEKEEAHPQPSTIELLTKMLVLFVGLFFHNVFVGLALGIADNDYVLFIALVIHHFLEGIGMGSRVAVAKLGRIITVLCIDLLFALTPAVFIGIGIGIRNGIAEADADEGYGITKGTFEALSAGMLIYVSLVHMLRGYKDIGVTGVRLDLHRLVSYIGLVLGAAIMSVIGIWA